MMPTHGSHQCQLNVQDTTKLTLSHSLPLEVDCPKYAGASDERGGSGVDQEGKVKSVPRIVDVDSLGVVLINWTEDMKVPQDKLRRLTENGLNIWVEPGSIDSIADQLNITNISISFLS